MSGLTGGSSVAGSIHSRTIFISYSHQDAAVVRRLTDDLRGDAFSIWIDHEAIQPGTPNWEKTIHHGMQASRSLVFIAVAVWIAAIIIILSPILATLVHH
jgi:hypothetical protein